METLWFTGLHSNQDIWEVRKSQRSRCVAGCPWTPGNKQPVVRHSPEGCFFPFQKLYQGYCPAPWWLRYWLITVLRGSFWIYIDAWRTMFQEIPRLLHDGSSRAARCCADPKHRQVLPRCTSCTSKPSCFPATHLPCNAPSLGPPKNELPLETYQNWVYKLLRQLLVFLIPRLIAGPLSSESKISSLY